MPAGRNDYIIVFYFVYSLNKIWHIQRRDTNVIIQ